MKPYWMTVFVFRGVSSSCLSQEVARTGWTRLLLSTGATVEYPADIFRLNKTPTSSAFPVFDRDDANAHFTFFLKNNQDRQSLSMLADTKTFPVSYKRVSSRFLVVSGVWKDMVVNRRCNGARDKSQLACFDIAYPRSEVRDWDQIVTRISRSLKAG